MHAPEFDHALVVILDDLGTDKVGAYAADVSNPGEDRPETPTLDLLAAAGVRFTDAWAAPECSPSRAMFLTGAWPSRTGVGHTISNGENLRVHPLQDTLARLAADSGLRTGLFGKSHFGESGDSLDEPGALLGRGEWPIRLGFGTFEGTLWGDVPAYDDWLQYDSRRLDPTRPLALTVVSHGTTDVTDVTTEDAVAWMSRARGRRLTVVGYNLPHDTPGGGRGRWANGAEVCGATASNNVEDMKVMVECADDELRELLSRTPDLERTVVVVFGDNGTDATVSEYAFADGRGKGTAYENGVRVPLIVADGAAVALALRTGGPLPELARFRVDAGGTVTDPVSVVDLYATLADLLGLASSTCTPGVTCAPDSVSLAPALVGGAVTRDEVWTEKWDTNQDGAFGWAALRAGDVKLVVHAPYGEDCRAYELYDLAADRWETVDRWDDPSYAAEQADLEARLAAREADMPHAWIPPARCAE